MTPLQNPPNLPAVKRLFIVDAMAMAFRNYHAFSAKPLATSKGLPTSAVFGSANFLVRLLESEQPDYFAIAMDSREPTFRHHLYSGYKANRKAMPLDLAQQLPYLSRLYDALGVKVLVRGGLEADDLIGTMVHRFASDELHCYIVSGDKDFMQLIGPRVSLYSPKKGNEVVLTDVAGVQTRFGCRPDQVIDILALTGDSSDNVPGVYGIGDKGAATLVQKYGSLDGIYAHLDEITNKRHQEGLATDREKAYLARQLVTIKTDAGLDFDLESIRCEPRRHLARPELGDLFEELEFMALAAKVRRGFVAGTTVQVKTLVAPAAEAPVALSSNADYLLVNNWTMLQAMLAELRPAPVLSVDSETTGLDVMRDLPVGMSFAVKRGHGYYVPLLDQVWGSELPAVKAALNELLSQPQQLKVGHNLKFDLHMLCNFGIAVKGPMADTMVASWLLDSSGRSHGLDASCLKYLNYAKIPTTDLIGKDASINMRDVPLDKLTRYAVEDADLTLQLYEALKGPLADKELEFVFYQIEMPLLPILVAMEREGVFVDSDALLTISDSLDRRAKALTLEIHELAGEAFNLNSPKQLQQILFEKLKLQESAGKTQRIKKTKSGYSTDISVLEQLDSHPIIRALLDYRQVTKIKGTYVDSLPQLIFDGDGRLHTTFHQTGTATGRLSSSDPNLQNIPVRSVLGREVRSAFRAARPGWVLVSADYSQVELRLLAHMADDVNLQRAFRDDLDIHTATAARIFGVALEEVSPSQRGAAKAINFGIIYGMGPHRLAREIGVSNSEAKDFITRYFATYPGIREFIDLSIATAKRDQYTKTISGRRRPLPEIASSDRVTQANAQNIAVNSPVQGSAADLIKLAMVRVQKQLDETSLNAKMLLQVHDELVFECPPEEVPAISELVRREMSAALALKVPLKVDIGSGSNWLEAH